MPYHTVVVNLKGIPVSCAVNGVIEKEIDYTVYIGMETNLRSVRGRLGLLNV